MVTHLLAALMATGLAVASTDSNSPKDQSLEQAARVYRIGVYNTFRLDRAEFNRRRAEWSRIETAWEAAGKPDRELPELRHWLDEATAHSHPDSIGPLPEAPRFAADLGSRKDDEAQWRVILDDGDKVLAPADDPAPKSEPSEKSPPAPAAGANATTPPDSGEQRDAGKVATPVSSTSTLQLPAAEEKKPADETAPVPVPIAPNRSADQNVAPQTSAADKAGWLHALGEELGQDINNLAVTLSWKRESK